jgi:queuine tRNA-ribosyltransferase/7-cyano-7-deazaguanine tRNA-ribosyltransferase
MEFKILKKSKRTKARLGIIKTKHGVIETPCFVPVATQAVIKTLTSEEAEQAKCQVLICNTFHLHLKPGEKVITNSEGLHKFMNWKRPLMTDSGGFQVFSLGFGKDLNVGKILKRIPEKQNVIEKSQQPKSLKITDEGVIFQSPIDGKKLFIGPKESMKIQRDLGADIVFAFDECTPPLASLDYIKKSLDRTHKWAKICIKEKNSGQALFGIAQGSEFKNLRQESAKFINSLGFDGFGIGGDLGRDKSATKNILKCTIPFLDERKPRHLLGIGYLNNIEDIIKEGIDLFDCTVPTHLARRGIVFANSGKLDLKKTKFLKDKKPIDSKCDCLVCRNYKRNYISHLFKANEITAMRLATFHNLYFFNAFVEKIREKIKRNTL